MWVGRDGWRVNPYVKPVIKSWTIFILRSIIYFWVELVWFAG